MFKKILTLVLAAVFSLPLMAAGASKKAAVVPPNPEEVIEQVKKAVESKLGVKVVSVVKSPYLNLFEVYADGQILYTDEKLTALIAGTLIDGKTMKNVTAERMQKLAAIKFSDLPLELAIREMADAGKPTVVGAPESRAAEIYRAIARRIAVKVAERAKDMSSKFPNIVVQNT